MSGFWQGKSVGFTFKRIKVNKNKNTQDKSTTHKYLCSVVILLSIFMSLLSTTVSILCSNLMQYQPIPPGVTVICRCSLGGHSWLQNHTPASLQQSFIVVNGHYFIVPVALFSYFQTEPSSYLRLVIHNAETVCRHPQHSPHRFLSSLPTKHKSRNL